MRRLLGAFHVTGVFWFRFHRWGMIVLPEWALPIVLTVFTSFFFVILRRIRAAIASNLEAVLGPCGWWTRQRRIFRTMWTFAWCLSERYEMLSTDRAATVSIDGEEHWHEALASARGLVLVTAHIGHWETGAMGAPDRHLHVVREEEMDPRAQTFIRELFAEQAGAGFTMHFAHDDPSLGPRMLGFLRRGDFVAVQGDRPRTAGRTVTIEVFGRPLQLPIGPVALARAAGVAMMPVFVFRRGRLRAEAVVRPPVHVGSGHQGLEDAMRRIARDIEWAVQQAPHQWFCFRKLWP